MGTKEEVEVLREREGVRRGDLGGGGIAEGVDDDVVVVVVGILEGEEEEGKMTEEEEEEGGRRWETDAILLGPGVAIFAAVAVAEGG